MKRLHRLLSALCALVLSALVIALSPLAARAAEVVYSGTWGTCPWEISAEGVLSVYPGTGADQHGLGFSPWSDYGASITRIEFVPSGGALIVLPEDSSYLLLGLHRAKTMDLSGLDTSHVTDMSGMFEGCSSLSSLDISTLDTSSVTDMGWMFSKCRNLSSLDLSSIDTSSVMGMEGMFWSCSSLSSIDLSSFDTSSVTDIGWIFNGCSSLTTLDLSSLDTSNVTSMWCMFYGCSGLSSLDLSSFDTSSVTDMGSMFGGCSGLTSLDLSPLDTSNVTEMGGMFGGCSGLTSLDLSPLDTSNATNLSSMFDGCSSLTSLDLSGFDTSKATSIDYMFRECSSLTSLDLSTFDTTKMDDMMGVFSGCSSLTSLDLSGFDTSRVTRMYRMFYGCPSLFSLDLSSFDTAFVLNMESMFEGCSSLTSLNLSGSFNTSSVVRIGAMFKDCSNLETIYVGSGWTIETIEESGEMFQGCVMLVGGNGTAYDENHTDAQYARVDSRETPGYLTDRLASLIDINNATVSGVDEVYVFTGNSEGIRPVPVVTYNGRTLVEGIDYEVAYQDNLYVGRAYGSDDHLAFVIISGKGQFGEGEFKGFKFVGFSIEPAPVSNATIGAIPDQLYTGSAIEPAVSVKLGSMTLVEGFDYTVSYADNINPGIATVTVTGTDEGNLTGSVTMTFTISDVIIDDGVASFVDGSRAYLLDLDAPAGVTVRAGEDPHDTYRPPYTDGEGNLYCWPDAGSELFVEIPCERLVSGFALSPAGAGSVRWDADLGAFEVSLTAPATLKISMERIEYVPASEDAPTGVAVDVPASLVDEFDGVTLAVEERTGDAVEDAKVVISQYSEDGFTLDDAVLLDIHYEDEAGSEIAAPTEADGASMKVTLPVPEGWDASKVRVYYMETSTNSDGANFTFPQDMNATPTADGKSVVFYTTHFSDYAMAYDMDAVSARVDLSRAVIDPIPAHDYTGDAIEPQVKVTLDGLELAEIVDYSVTYRDNIGPGIATIIIEGAGNYAGIISTTFEIVSDEPQPIDISGATIAPIPDQAFTGRPITPEFEVSLGETVLIAGTDYRVTYKYNVDPGTAVVVVEGIGGYAGTVKGVFTILQPVNPFCDVSERTGHYEDILWLASSGISRGWDMGDGIIEFRPYANVARADMAAFLCRLVNGKDYRYEPTAEDVVYFADVDWSTPHCREIWWLANQGISRGWTQGSKHYFRPFNNVARCDMACFLMRMALGSDAEESYAPHPAFVSYFSDVDGGTSHRSAVLWLAAEKVSQGWDVSGGSHEFRPYGNVARADMAAFLHRMEANGLVTGGNNPQTQ
ncbi:MAG: BspA family leucine-rich repeat surface protein [Atopobiaceae bacterium]|nr:BspA family leucine-rich repeat surface protein [Atopobiaceae bacterium]